MNKLFVLILFVYSALTGYAQENTDKIKLSLNEAIKIASENNPDATAAVKEIDAAGGKILQAGRLQNAELSLEANEISSKFDLGETGELDISFNQPFEFFSET